MKGLRKKFNDFVREKGNSLGRKINKNFYLGDYLTEEINPRTTTALATVGILASGVGCAQTSTKEQVYEGLDVAHDVGYVVEGEKFKARETQRLNSLKRDVDNFTRSKIQGDAPAVKELKKLDKEISGLEESLTDKSKEIADEYKGLANDLTAATNIAILGKESKYNSPKFRKESKRTREMFGLEFYTGILKQDRKIADNLATLVGQKNKDIYKTKVEDAHFLGTKFNINFPESRWGIQGFYHMFPENQEIKQDGTNYKSKITSEKTSFGFGPTCKVFDGNIFDVDLSAYFSKTNEEITGGLTLNNTNYSINESGTVSGLGANARFSWGNDNIKATFNTGYDYTRLNHRDNQNTEGAFTYSIGLYIPFGGRK